MVRSGAAHSARECQWRQRLRVAEEANGLVDSGRAFFGADSRVAGKNQNIATHVASQFLNKSRIERGVLPGQIHFTNDGSARGGIIIFSGSERRQREDNREKQGGRKLEAHLWQL
jgi:hypothetical protein